MKTLIFTYNGYDNTNIGDYIQSLAAKQFISKNDDIIFYNRDELNHYEGEPAKVIMNGWFTHKPENWPPSSQLIPLFVSFHINSSAYSSLLSEESIQYLKRYEPIGCRDKNTAKKLNKVGVNSYFSSCLTTTLGHKYKKTIHGDKIYVVDPVHYIPELSSRYRKYKFLIYFLFHLKGIKDYIQNIRNNCNYDFSYSFKYYDRFAALVRSYMIVRQILSKEDMKKIVVLTQFHKAKEYPNDNIRFKRAEELINLYSEAKLVITSRIHCALPCIGLETPVIFLKNLDDSLESTCRFEGLLDLCNKISFRRNRIIDTFVTLPLRSNDIKNKELYKEFAYNLITKVKNFIG